MVHIDIQVNLNTTLVLAPLARASRICKLEWKGKWKLYLACPTGQVHCNVFRVYFWKRVQTFRSGILACPRKYAFTCQHHVLLGFKWSITKYIIFQGQVKAGVGQVKVESHLPYWASRRKSWVIFIWRILHMTDQFSWSNWVCHIQVHLYCYLSSNNTAFFHSPIDISTTLLEMYWVVDLNFKIIVKT